MPWIARDKTGSNPYRIFGTRPMKKEMGLDGVHRDAWTWTCDPELVYNRYYRSFANHEPTVLPDTDSPVCLGPGEGPVEVTLAPRDCRPG